jgi:uncharacterized protein DUF4242
VDAWPPSSSSTVTRITADLLRSLDPAGLAGSPIQSVGSAISWKGPPPAMVSREGDIAMRRFLIEREIPGVEKLDAEGLSDAARTSNAALAKLGPDIQWVESYVVADKTFCVYLAKDEDVIREHARISGFPANRISEIETTIDPTTER